MAPGERLRMPTVTLGVFRDGFDDMGERLYDWQYEYQWSYTTDEYYALTLWPTIWWGDSHNLQQTFAGRLGWMDMAWPDMMREAGVEMLWDDAGWSEAPDPATWPAGGYGGVFHSTHQGPDFSRTLRYLSKSGGKWVAWFCGNNPRAVMDNKVGAWGDFQWRTDGIGTFNLKTDQAWRQTITGFLRAHPRSTLQTCNGGSTASHMFDLQSYAHNNYFSDGRIPDKTNYLLFVPGPAGPLGGHHHLLRDVCPESEGREGLRFPRHVAFGADDDADVDGPDPRQVAARRGDARRLGARRTGRSAPERRDVPLSASRGRGGAMVLRLPSRRSKATPSSSIRSG